MSAVITALRFRKGNRDRVDVYLDGRRAVTLPAVQAASPEIVEEALATLEGEEETAYQLARARVSRWRDLDRARFWQRAGGFLTRRGFSHETVRAVLERLWEELQARDERSVPEVADGEGAVGE